MMFIETSVKQYCRSMKFYISRKSLFTSDLFGRLEVSWCIEGFSPHRSGEEGLSSRQAPQLQTEQATPLQADTNRRNSCVLPLSIPSCNESTSSNPLSVSVDDTLAEHCSFRDNNNKDADCTALRVVSFA